MLEKIHQSDTLKLADGRVIDLVGTLFKCPGCGHEHQGSAKQIESFHGFTVVQCLICNLWHLSPLPDEDALKLLYNTGYFKDVQEKHGYLDYSQDAAAIEKTYEKRFDRFMKHLTDASQITRVHEIGCALGFGLSRIQQRYDFDLSASDISEEAVAATRDCGVPSFVADRYGRCALPAGSVDLIYYFDVIEHLADIQPFISWQQEVLAPGGYVVFTTPIMDTMLNRMLGRRSPSYKIPQHVSYFTDQTVMTFFSGWATLVASFNDYQYVSLTGLINRVLHISNIRGLHLERYLHWTLPIPNGMKLYVFRKR